MKPCRMIGEKKRKKEDEQLHVAFHYHDNLSDNFCTGNEIGKEKNVHMIEKEIDEFKMATLG